ncbi:DUF1120 domain-containing protein [Yersinia hibernica]|uniref:DUF1120 domain-containing protein n=1 Tax=Yersinia hibernica TaxID=2339259 RepID=A0ABX5R1C2_9GAMM|nr:DUF1120 domain-containing protein [Yersinia hibernica]QAX79420.1 DUF1120 domain-containing protein [Yersinia hibernica]
MSKQLVKVVMLSSLIFSSAVAVAAPPIAELKVAGKLSVPTCVVNSPDGGIYDLGKISSTKISSTNIGSLDTMTKTWAITCDATTYLTFKTIDNRTASAFPPSTSTYGLGMVNGTGKIGSFFVNMQNAKVDGVPVKVFNTKASTFTVANDSQVFNDDSVHGWASANNVQTAGKIFTTDMAVGTYLSTVSGMNGPITQNTEIDGSMTINFAYGI